jgi:hypothetical protein
MNVDKGNNHLHHFRWNGIYVCDEKRSIFNHLRIFDLSSDIQKVLETLKKGDIVPDNINPIYAIISDKSFCTSDKMMNFSTTSYPDQK